jgi:hypothetical protein
VVAAVVPDPSYLPAVPTEEQAGMVWLVGTTSYVVHYYNTQTGWQILNIASGPQGPPGQAGATGLTGGQGVAGPAGQQGPVGPQGAPGNMGTLVKPAWQSASSLLTSPWATVSGSTISYLIDGWGRCQLRGEVYFPGGNPVDGTAIMACPPSTTPTQNTYLLAIEDVIPARVYSVEIGTDGNIRLQSPSLNTTGQLFLDNLSWMTQ